MAELNFTFTGVRELANRLERFEPRIGKGVVRRGLRVGAKIIGERAKELAFSVVGFGGGTGSEDMGAKIANSIGVRAAKARFKGEYSVRVAVDPSGKHNDEFVHISAQGVRTYVPNAIEYGHAAPGMHGGPKIVGPMSYMRKAFDQTYPHAAKAAQKVIKRGIELAMNPKYQQAAMLYEGVA